MGLLCRCQQRKEQMLAKEMTCEEYREQLREWREDGGRHSDEVVEFWDEGLESSIDELGEERWMVLEQVAVAGLDCNRSEVVQECLERLVEQFGPSSLRIKRLIAMKMEMMEKWDDAVEVLDAIIEEDEANSSARKRKIAIFKAQGDRARTVAELNKYLKVFMSSRRLGWSCVTCTSWTKTMPKQLSVARRCCYTTHTTTSTTRGKQRSDTLGVATSNLSWRSTTTARQ